MTADQPQIYDDTMYLRGYSSTQILQAIHNQMINEWFEKQIMREQEREIQQRIDAEAETRAYKMIEQWLGSPATAEAVADKIADTVIDQLKGH